LTLNQTYLNTKYRWSVGLNIRS